MLGPIHLYRVLQIFYSTVQNQVHFYFITNFFFKYFLKKDFIRSSQALEIISLIFYVIAALFIIIGLLNLRVFPYERAFVVAIGLLFLSSKLSSMNNSIEEKSFV